MKTFVGEPSTMIGQIQGAVGGATAALSPAQVRFDFIRMLRVWHVSATYVWPRARTRFRQTNENWNTESQFRHSIVIWAECRFSVSPLNSLMKLTLHALELDRNYKILCMRVTFQEFQERWSKSIDSDVIEERMHISALSQSSYLKACNYKLQKFFPLLLNNLCNNTEKASFE